jgi:hypothetical protein
VVVALVSFAGWLTMRDRADAPPTPRAPITAQQAAAIAQGQSAINAALAYVRADLSVAGQPPVDYAPNCSAYGCTAQLP